jgi:hypothetical protein
MEWKREWRFEDYGFVLPVDKKGIEFLIAL